MSKCVLDKVTWIDMKKEVIEEIQVIYTDPIPVDEDEMEVS